jgi:hypothetical protein
MSSTTGFRNVWYFWAVGIFLAAIGVWLGMVSLFSGSGLVFSICAVSELIVCTLAWRLASRYEETSFFERSLLAAFFVGAEHGVVLLGVLAFGMRQH